VAPLISLALALHNHQPVGNFGWVFAEVFEQAYRPMVEALERHPHVRVSLHYTGALLEWLAAERPGFLERLRDLVARGQVEILGGGLYEPVLISLPERDRLAQLTRMADLLESTFGRRPDGAWLAERVWEPSLPTSLADAGYRWTILDDAHFRAAAVPEEALWGPYTTDDQGRRLTVFGTEQGLRYRIPFRPVGEVISYLRDHATDTGDRLGTMGDDGEKFGAWPSTWDHCWGGGRWVDEFFATLEANADWLTTVTPSAWLAEHRPIGRAYLPAGSYAEMGEWAMPPEEGRAFATALHAAQAGGRAEARWLRGTSWRNFAARYREVNDLHKQMLRVSDLVAAMPPRHARELATDHLHRGQSNDCYWHGLFGGLYISHMRLATHEHLIAAEDLAEGALDRLTDARLADLDLDGADEVRLATPGQVVTIDPDEGGGIGAWDLRAARHALTAVVRRRPEAYHATLVAQEARAGRANGSSGSEVGVASIHEVVRAKESGLARNLVYDWHERRSGLVRFLPADVLSTDASAPGSPGSPGSPDPAADRSLELGDFVDGRFEVLEVAPGLTALARTGIVEDAAGRRAVRVEKAVRLDGTRLAPTLALDLVVSNRSSLPLRSLLVTEWVVTLAGAGGNPAAWWDVDGRRTAHDVAGTARGAEVLRQGNDDVGITLSTRPEPSADAWWAPVETISNSEAGFERVYQGSALRLGWPLDLAPGASWRGRVKFSVESAIDRAAPETAARAPSP